jgi:hypothetical protein
MPAWPMVSIHHDDLRARLAEQRVNECHCCGPASDDKVIGFDRLRVHRSPSGTAPRVISGAYSAMSARANLAPFGDNPVVLRPTISVGRAAAAIGNGRNLRIPAGWSRREADISA